MNFACRAQDARGNSPENPFNARRVEQFPNLSTAMTLRECESVRPNRNRFTALNTVPMFVHIVPGLK